MPEFVKPIGILPANRPARIRGLAVVAALGIGSAAIILALRPRLPDPVATHFAGSTPDGFESVTATAVIAFAFSVGLGVFLVMAGVMAPGDRWVRRMVVGIGISTAAFIALVFLGVVLTQVDLENATDARPDWRSLLYPLAAALFLGWALSHLVRE